MVTVDKGIGKLVLPEEYGDDELLSRARRGDKAAISQIYHRYVEPIYQFARQRLGNAQAAEDITSTVFEKLIDALARGKGPQQHLRGWLYQVARNAIYDSYGKRQPLPLETIEQWRTTLADDPEWQVSRSFDVDVVLSLIESLPAAQQEVLLLRFNQQLSLQETADVLEKNINTVKALQFKAMNRLRELIQDIGMEA